MDITKLDEKELKALAFDLLQQRDQITANLNVVLEQLGKLDKPKPKEGK